MAATVSRMWCFVSLTTCAGSSRPAAPLMYVLSFVMIALIAFPESTVCSPLYLATESPERAVLSAVYYPNRRLMAPDNDGGGSHENPHCIPRSIVPGRRRQRGRADECRPGSALSFEDHRVQRSHFGRRRHRRVCARRQRHHGPRKNIFAAADRVQSPRRQRRH